MPRCTGRKLTLKLVEQYKKLEEQMKKEKKDMATEQKNKEKWTLKDVKLVEEDGKYYLTTKYDLETDTDIREVTVDRVPLPLDYRPVISEECEDLWSDNRCVAMPPTHFVSIGYGKMRIPERKEPFYFEKVKLEKVQELTLEEIEKRLGFKVKVVSEKKVYIKGRDCKKCRYNCRNCGIIKHGPKHCFTCKMRNSRDFCKCTDINNGEPCPYFEEE